MLVKVYKVIFFLVDRIAYACHLSHVSLGKLKHQMIR